ncbi:Cytochrome P450 [Sergentomyia squamirostris]
MLLVLLTICGLVLILHHFWTNRKLYELSWKLPGPLWVPLIGNTYNIIGRTHEGLLDLLDYFINAYPGPIRRYWFATKLFILISKPNDIQTVLNAPECLNRAYVYKYMDSITGNGLLSLPVETWKNHRKYLNPTFSLKMLQSFISIFNKEARTLTNRLNELLGKPAFDIYRFMDACTLDIVCQTTMGTEMHIQKNQNVNYMESVNNLLLSITTRIFNPLLQLDILFRLTKWYSIEKKSNRIVFGFVEKILQGKKEMYQQIQQKFKHVEQDESVSTPQIYIDQLLKLSMETGVFNDDEVINEACTIVATGFESTAVTLSYVVLMLAMHSDVQDKVYEEICAVVADPNDLKHEELNDLKYTERVIKETLRLFPIIAGMARVVSAPFQLREYTIPANTYVGISILTLHRDKTVWGPKAEEFDPDHFLPENLEKIHPYAFVPFSAGPRNCIGSKYAYMMMKIVVVHLVKNYKFTTDLKLCDLKHRFNITLKLCNKHMVSITART